VEAAHRVEIRPRVAGHVAAVLFREGDIVRAGQPLLRIDTRPFDAALDRARAELQLARAKETLARSEAERAQRLAVDQAIAMEEVERRSAAHAEAQARSAAAQATFQVAALDREFALITAPVTGRIGRALVTPGNYVTAGGPAVAAIAGAAPLHVYFDLADPQLIAQVAGAREAGRWQARILDAGSGAEIAAAPVDFVDNEVSPQAGTLRLRARLDRPHAALLPGQFVRVQFSGQPQDSLLVPEKAIAADQGRRFVLVLKDGKADYRAIQPGAAQGEMRIVTAGLSAGEKVIVSGLMKLRPGMAVQAQEPRSAP
jgi:RND family efflux transporter MFP subunit